MFVRWLLKRGTRRARQDRVNLTFVLGRVILYQSKDLFLRHHMEAKSPCSTVDRAREDLGGYFAIESGLVVRVWDIV